MTEPAEDPIEALFNQAVELPPGERATFLQAACGGDPALRAEVESLLSWDGRTPCSGAWLESPLVRRPRDATSCGVERLPEEEAGIPGRIGRYRILRCLGEGGMGVVYEAEQDNPRRLVALKVIRPGLVSPGQLRRFHREAQILGRLHHPGIAQIHEAGLEEDGRPFLVMELIRGVPLDEYARGHLPDRPSRLGLLVRVAEAVQHAHDHGIIHRDLKPGNILVDDTGQPRVLDFGVSRDRGVEEPTAGTRTQTGQLIGTLQYMSPEQVAGNPGAVDERSDVYALGVILFELVAQRRPYQLENLPLPEALRVIREDEPIPLRTLDTTLRGDIETIVGKALDKDRARRYATAGELAADLRRHLGHEPIRARPPSRAYRVRKFVRRYKALVAGVLAVMATLVLGLAGVAWMYLDAQREAEKARRARDFLVSILRISENDDRGGSVTARQILTDAEKRIPGEFAEQPRLRAELVRVVGDVKSGMARRAPRAMILEVGGTVTVQSTDGRRRPAISQSLLKLDDRLSLSADARVRLVYLSDLHQEGIRPGREAAVGLDGSRPSDAVLERDDSVLMTFARLPRGTFFLGWDDTRRKQGVSTSIPQDLEIAVHEVTQGQWQAVMGSNPSSFTREGKNHRDVVEISDEELKLFPVESVSWHDAQQFLRRLNERERGRGYVYRLPTEAEWEYGCRGGSRSRKECSYHFYFNRPTNDLSSEMANFNGNKPYGNAPDGNYLRRPARVGSYPPNRLGLCDMHGNVWEWCDDAFPENDNRPGRGGGWFGDGTACKAISRSRGRPGYRHHDLGFRLVRVPDRSPVQRLGGNGREDRPARGTTSLSLIF